MSTAGPASERDDGEELDDDDACVPVCVACVDRVFGADEWQQPMASGCDSVSSDTGANDTTVAGRCRSPLHCDKSAAICGTSQWRSKTPCYR